MDKVEEAIHSLINRETPVRPGKPARTHAEEQALAHGYARGWEDRGEADTPPRRDSGG